jgi:hypothetical protein
LKLDGSEVASKDEGSQLAEGLEPLFVEDVELENTGDDTLGVEALCDDTVGGDALNEEELTEEVDGDIMLEALAEKLDNKGEAGIDIEEGNDVETE